jgi:hypothetical protein
MRTWRTLLLFLTVSVAGACASIEVNHEADPEADFGAYGTYDWMPAESRRVDLRARDPLDEQRLRDAIEAELRDKGLRKVDSGEPDILIGYLLVLEDGMDSQTMYVQSDPDWRYRTYGPATTTTRTTDFTMGTLIIDVHDVEEKALVWRGVAEGQVDQTQDPEKRRARINKAVQKILEEFPPTG